MTMIPKKKQLVFAMLAMSAIAMAEKVQSRNAFSGAFSEMAGGDQAEFIATVNRSLADPDKPLDDRQIKTLYSVNRDAVRGAPAADRKTVLAEVFATVPRACLPTIADRFAAELFSRKAAGFGDSDDSFVEFASAALMRISLRCRTADDFPGTRTAYAVIMFLKASEGRPASLREDFMMYIHSGTHRIAREEWIPAALGDGGRPPTYAPMIEAGIKGEEPRHKIAFPQGPPEELNRLVGSEMRVDHAWDVSGPQPEMRELGISADGGLGSGVWRVPRDRMHDSDSPWYRRRRVGGGGGGEVRPPVEPELYVGQTLCGCNILGG